MKSDCVKATLGVVLMICLLLGLVLFAVFIFRDNNETPANGHVAPWGFESTSIPTSEAKTPSSKDGQVSTTLKTGEYDALGYEIKLNLGSDNSSGQVYIQYGDRLGFVCSDGFDDREATVVCRELGYRTGLKYDMLSHPSYHKYTDYEPILSGLRCYGNESRLQECDDFDLDENVTSCTWFAAVVCYNGEQPYELRLINNHGGDSGLVEMKLGGVWGVVCAIRTFDDELADILCRNMNYTGGITMDRGQSGEVTNNNVWVPYVSCDVGEPVKKTLFECNLILHTGNILKDRTDFRSNRYINEYMACFNKPDSFAAAVHCLHM